MGSLKHTFPPRTLQKYTYSTYNFIPIGQVVLSKTISMDEEGVDSCDFSIEVLDTLGNPLFTADLHASRNDSPELWSADGWLCEVQDYDQLDLSKWNYKQPPA
jgi:hypothetical protein